jgi:putative transposase
MFTTIRNQYETRKYAVYTILGYTIEGEKEILGLWLNETEGKHKWMQICDEIKARGVEDIFFCL